MLVHHRYSRDQIAVPFQGADQCAPRAYEARLLRPEPGSSAPFASLSEQSLDSRLFPIQQSAAELRRELIRALRAHGPIAGWLLREAAVLRPFAPETRNSRRAASLHHWPQASPGGNRNPIGDPGRFGIVRTPLGGGPNTATGRSRFSADPSSSPR